MALKHVAGTKLASLAYVFDQMCGNVCYLSAREPGCILDGTHLGVACRDVMRRVGSDTAALFNREVKESIKQSSHVAIVKLLGTLRLPRRLKITSTDP